MNRRFRRLMQKVKRRWLHSKRRPLSENHLTENTILLASSGRSGSTWLAEAFLNSNKQMRYLFEPLHPLWVPEFRLTPTRIYLSPTSETQDNQWSDSVSNVLAGKLTSPWIDQHNKCQHAAHRLIKCIRANFLLPWVRKNHPEIRIVFLVRNPMYQALSAVKGSWFETTPDSLRFAAALPSFEKYNRLIEDSDHLATTPFTNGIRFWCLENAFVLNELDDSQIHFVYYEDLVAQAAESVPALFRAVGLQLSDDWRQKMARPSKTSRQTGIASSYVDQVSPSDVKSARAIIDMFSLAHLYDHGDQPVAQGADRFLGQR